MSRRQRCSYSPAVSRPDSSDSLADERRRSRCLSSTRASSLAIGAGFRRWGLASVRPMTDSAAPRAATRNPRRERDLIGLRLDSELCTVAVGEKGRADAVDAHLVPDHLDPGYGRMLETSRALGGRGVDLGGVWAGHDLSRSNRTNSTIVIVTTITQVARTTPRSTTSCPRSSSCCPRRPLVSARPPWPRRPRRPDSTPREAVASRPSCLVASS